MAEEDGGPTRALLLPGHCVCRQVVPPLPGDRDMQVGQVVAEHQPNPLITNSVCTENQICKGVG